MRGKFITFEGSEGSGKSTQSKMLYSYLKKKGYKVISLREPGNTQVGEKIRGILLNPQSRISSVTEMLLYMAARAEVVEEVIKPALSQGKIVICDRFLDSTLAYQGYGLGVDISLIKSIGKLVTQGVKPDLTIFLDLPVKQGLAKCGRIKDRIEKRAFEYHRRVRQGYLSLARFEPGRIKIVRVEKDKIMTQEKIRRAVLNVI
ncbi:MAG: dTMP kinase [Candidatus Omnitrophota bacterium]